MKKILGIDLGSSSIGWAYVKKNDTDVEIIKSGVRVIPITSDEQKEFDSGNSISTNLVRREKRHARRNKARFKLRLKKLKEILLSIGFYDSNLVIPKNKIWELRAIAPKEKIQKEEIGALFLMINKKRGYKSSRKVNTDDGDGSLIDNFEIAKELKEKQITPGQYSFRLIEKEKYVLPEFYTSDLENELSIIWNKQAEFYPETFTTENFEKFKGRNKTESSNFFTKEIKIYPTELKENKNKNKKKKIYSFRDKAVTEKLDLESAALILVEINNDINKSKNYLGDISNRSKSLKINNQTIGQYHYEKLQKNEHAIIKNQVFLREDYLTEFNAIWDKQSQFYKELTPKLKNEICKRVIFYQRPLKSQKHTIAFCEFEQNKRCIAKSSPFFQIFKIWQNINNIIVTEIDKNKKTELSLEQKQLLFKHLNLRGKLEASEILKILNYKKSSFELNFKFIEGNDTLSEIIKSIENIFHLEGYDSLDFKKLSPDEIETAIYEIGNDLGFDTSIINFDPFTKNHEQQLYFKLWHLLYSYEGTDENLYKLLHDKFKFSIEHAKLIAKTKLITSKYASLSQKAICKILPHLIEGLKYGEACKKAGYNHSHSLTKDEISQKKLKPYLELIKKNSLRNPVVEKVINQLINLINAIIENPEMGRPDEIRIEMARELKMNSKQRKNREEDIRKGTVNNQRIRQLLQEEFKFKNVTKNDITRYKLWEETGGMDIYTGRMIEKSDLYSKKYDIEHILPKSKIFNDSFSNKTLCEEGINRKKSNRTAIDYFIEEYGKDAPETKKFENRVIELYKKRKIKKAKYNYLLMTKNKMPTNFISRQLNETQYIAKKAIKLLSEICSHVETTTGSITARLRKDWGLESLMQLLNWDKYDSLDGYTNIRTNDHGHKFYEIKDWSKRDDQRHHAIDAIVIALTKQNYIQYLNGENADVKDSNIIHENIKRKELHYNKGKEIFNLPCENFRKKVEDSIQQILTSYKAKNKVTTKNINKIKVKGKIIKQETLTPRSRLHKDTVFGKILQYETKEIALGANMNVENAKKITKQKYRDAVLQRLQQFDNDPKKAFGGKNSIVKNPLFYDTLHKYEVPSKLKIVTQIPIFTKRVEINKDIGKNIDKIIDAKVKKILLERLQQFDNDSKKAFINIENNPIWMDKKNGIQIKNITMRAVSEAISLGKKHDHFGNEILSDDGTPIANNYVQTGNNHHVAIYRDAQDNFYESVVSYFEATHRKLNNLPIISPVYIDEKTQTEAKLLFTLKQNEYFILSSNDFNPHEIDLTCPNNNAIISKRLFRVQKLASKDYVFRHHLETTVQRTTVDEKGNQTKVDDKSLKGIIFERIQSLPNKKNIDQHQLLKLMKVHINCLGEITKIGE